MRAFYVRAPLHVIARLDAMVTHLARILLELGDPGNDDERRVRAVLILTNPKPACELLEQYAAWLHRSDDPAMPDPEPEEARNGNMPEVDWQKLMPTVILFLHAYTGGRRPASPASRATGPSPTSGSGTTSVHTPVHRHAGLRPRGPGAGRRLRDPGST